MSARPRLVYRASSTAARATQKNQISKNQKRKKNLTNTNRNYFVPILSALTDIMYYTDYAAKAIILFPILR